MAVNPKLRWAILHRDNYACRYCGATAADGVTLEVDHLIPKSRGGRNVATNLLAACNRCNSGKSDTPLCSSPIDDVPQEVFRRVCVERGVSSPACPGGDDCDHEPSLAYWILDIYDPEVKQQFIDHERIWLDDDVQPSESELEELAAREAYLAERRNRFRLQALVERLLLHHDQDRVQKHVDDADARMSNREVGNPPSALRYPVLVATAVEHLLNDLDKEAFSSLPHDEQSEWIEYAIALNGPGALDPQWGWDAERRVLEAAKVVRVVNAGLHHPIMCRAHGERITHCPRRAEHRVRVNGCSCCGADDSPEDSGHDLCGEHVDRLRAGKVTNRRDEPLSLRAVSDLAVSA